MTKAKMIGAVLGIVLGLVVAFMSPPAGLTVKSMIGLGVFLWAVIYLIFDVFPDYIVTLVMCGLWVLFGAVKFDVAFSFFSNSNWWVMIGAFGLGLAASKTGMLRRISLLVMKLLPSTFKGQSIAIIGSGAVISPLIPSFTAKAAICAPLSRGISDAMGYAPKSRGAAGLFAANVIGFIALAPAFLSASFLGFMIVSLVPKDLQGQFHWIGWFYYILPWTIVLLVLSYICIMYFYKPTEEDTLPAGYAADQLKAMGPMSGKEKITTIVIVLTLLFWMTGKLHGVDAATVAVLAVAVLLMLKVYDRVDFRSGITWDAAVFVGCIVGLGRVLPALGIDKWMGTALFPYTSPLFSNPYLFVVGLSIIIYVLRFFILSQTATIAIFMVMLTPLAVQAGFNPWIVAMVIYVAGNTWTVFYQNAPYVTAYYAVGGDMVNHGQIAKLSVAYMVISIIGLLVCVPFWQLMGLIK